MNSYQTTSRPLVSTYLAEIKAFRPWPRTEEVALSHKVQRDGCCESRDALIHGGLRFVVRIAKEYQNLGLPLEDLVSDGNVGLIEAARRFDGSRGTRFITYAVWWVRKSIMRALDAQARTVRVPVSRLRKLRQIREVEEEMRCSMGRKPTRGELALRLNRQLDHVESDLQFDRSVVSIEEPWGAEGELTIADSLVDPGAEDARDALIQSELLPLLDSALGALSEQHRFVIRRRFGIPDGPCLTLQQIGSELNLSREWVRRIELQAKQALRRHLERMCGLNSSVKRR